MPTGFTSKIKSIYSHNTELNEAYTPMSISIVLEDEIDISRGDMIVRENNIPNVSQDIELLVTWMNQSPLSKKKKVIIKHTTNECIGLVES